MSEPAIEHDVALAPRTTLELGGPARFFVEARSEHDVAAALAWADPRGVRVAILGGGSNLVVPDAGFDGLVIAIATRGLALRADGDVVLAEVAAGEPWDALVERAVREDLAGLECLSGIPGLTGATPIQNVGAYGQDVSETIVSVRALDRRSRAIAALTPDDCAFEYRDSALKRDADRFVVLSVTFALRRGGEPTVRYAELERALEGRPRDLRTVRDTVVALRRAKSMVVDPADPNRRSAGSFFTNPIVAPELADALSAQHPDMPRWPQPDGRVKLAAGWLIERAGIAKGTRRGAVGVSTAHALALVHHGGATTRDLLALAEEIRTAVHARFAISLSREPVLWP